MKHPLVGIGAAGIVSTLAFTLFILPQSPSFEAGDVVDTTILLSLGFTALLAVGLARMARGISPRTQDQSPSTAGWSTRCPDCGRFIERRRTYCPQCGADLRFESGNSPPSLARENSDDSG